MNKTVKTTEIKKKYKDKKTQEWRELTIHHAKVKDRIKAFWEDNPRGKIETGQTKDGDTIIFKAHILADKSDEYSKEASGHSFGSIGQEKSFEKLETIAVGRALALIGYAADGEIASSEEMEEFNQYMNEKKFDAIAELRDCKTLYELKDKYMSLGSLMGDKAVIDVKNELKLTLSK